MVIDIGEKLRNLRLNKHWTQRQVADRIEIDESAISQYESCLRLPTLENLVKICDVFDVSADYLLDIRTDKSIKVRVDDLTDSQINSIIAVIDEYRKANKRD